MKLLSTFISALLLLLFASSASPTTKDRRPSPFIVGGTDASPYEFPFMVSMQYRSVGSDYVHRCGGAILNENWVVSASHCVENALVRNTRIGAGLHSQTNLTGTEQFVNVSAFFMHPDYNTTTLENDIVLLKLYSPLDFTTGTVGRITLPIQGQATEIGENSTVIGWGNLEFGNASRPDILQKVSLPVVSDEDCRAAYGPEDMFDSFLCAGFAEGGKDSCNGDSGGPLFTHDLVELIGIVSWGKECALPGYYGVYTEVSYFVHWINSIMSSMAAN